MRKIHESQGVFKLIQIMINVFYVEDHDIVREGIIVLLESEPGIQVTGQARNGVEALEKLATHQPDVILMDMSMPVMSGLECTRLVKKEFPQVKIIMLSMYDHESYLIDMLDAGANGYIIKNSSKEELVFAIKKVASDGIYIGPEFTLNMLAKYQASMNASSNTQTVEVDLTGREMDVLKLIAEGMTNNEIAKQLFTSVRTIETRRKNLLHKTKTINTATLIRFAVLNGLIK